MFTWVGAQFDLILDRYLVGVVADLSAAIAPVALSALSIWVLLYAWAVVRGEVNDTVPIFVWKTFKIGLALAFALQTGVYMDSLVDSANALAVGVASSFIPEAADTSVATSPFALIDQFNELASQLTLDLLMATSITRLDMLFAAVVCSIGNVIYLCIALFIVSLAKVFITFVLSVGPVFVLAAAWKPTVRFFDSWLSMLLSAVVLTWFVFFALGLSTYIGQTMLRAVLDNGGIAGPNFNPVAESLKYCVVMLLMAIICFQAPSLAAALTGGAVVQQGVQMLQSAIIAGGLRSRDSRPGQQAGGSIRAGVGAPYATGRAAGAAAAAAARATRATAGAAATAVRLPPYLSGALRGRR